MGPLAQSYMRGWLDKTGQLFANVLCAMRSSTYKQILNMDNFKDLEGLN